MANTNVALTLTVVAIVIYQAWVTLLVVNAPEYERRQKLWQIIFIWFVLPLLAAIAVHSMLASERAAPRKRDTSFTPGNDSGGNGGGDHAA
jgi:hypothetical protein